MKEDRLFGQFLCQNSACWYFAPCAKQAETCLRLVYPSFILPVLLLTHEICWKSISMKVDHLSHLMLVFKKDQGGGLSSSKFCLYIFSAVDRWQFPQWYSLCHKLPVCLKTRMVVIWIKCHELSLNNLHWFRVGLGVLSLSINFSLLLWIHSCRLLLNWKW